MNIVVPIPARLGLKLFPFNPFPVNAPPIGLLIILIGEALIHKVAGTVKLGVGSA